MEHVLKFIVNTLKNFVMFFGSFVNIFILIYTF